MKYIKGLFGAILIAFLTFYVSIGINYSWFSKLTKQYYGDFTFWGMDNSQWSDILTISLIVLFISFFSILIARKTSNKGILICGLIYLIMMFGFARLLYSRYSPEPNPWEIKAWLITVMFWLIPIIIYTISSRRKDKF